jgi:hypothetical protein
MWPAVLPRQVRESSLRAAEVKVYDMLAAALGNGWVVFYSRPWLGLTPSGEEKDGECDFIVMHPAHGYLTLEVKGGAISYDPATDQWRSTDRNRIRHNIKNPLQQAVASKHELLRQVKHLTSWPGRFVRQRHGVVFPDTASPPRNLGADGPREIFCCRDDLPNIARWIRDRLSGGTGRILALTEFALLKNFLPRLFSYVSRLGITSTTMSKPSLHSRHNSTTFWILSGT